MFAIHTLTAPAPLFEPAALRDRNFLIGVVVALIMGMLQYTPMVLFPPLLQELQGYPETTIGYLVASRGLGNLASFCIVAQLTRFDARLCLFIGLSIQAFAGAMMGGFDMQVTIQGVLWSNILHGFGFGLSYTPMAVLAFSTMPTRYMTQANAIFALIRMLGSSVFVSLTLLVLVHSTAEANVNLASSITALHPRPDRAVGAGLRPSRRAPRAGPARRRDPAAGQHDRLHQRLPPDDAGAGPDRAAGVAVRDQTIANGVIPSAARRSSWRS